MDYTLGGYSNQLKIGDFSDNELNTALRNSGASYQMPALQQADVMGQSARQQQTDLAPANAAPETPSVANLQDPKAEEKNQGAGLLKKVLGIVGTIYGGGAGAALGAASGAIGE